MDRRFDGKPETQELLNPPPRVQDFLAEQIDRIKGDLANLRRPWPQEVPANSFAAASWWIKHQKPANDHDERPRQVAAIGGGNRWECPYHLRLASTFRIYAALPELHRETIRAAFEDGVWWNGDQVFNRDGSPGMFMMIIEETAKMKQNPAQYIAETRARTRALLQQRSEK